MTPTLFDQVLAAARQLPPRERARLVAVVVEELAAPPTSVSAASDDVLAELDQLIAEAAAAGPTAVDSADLISELRR
jgi:hypothetical protein